MAERIVCPYCRLKHLPRHLCDPAKAVLDAMVARGESFTMPTIAFDNPVHDPGIGAPGDQLLRQLVVQAAVIPGAGVHYPALILGGRASSRVLPHWVYAGSDQQLRAVAQLVRDMAELAIVQADKQNAGGGRG